MSQPGHRVAFVLSGGASLGAVQAGMLRALYDRQIHRLIRGLGSLRPRGNDRAVPSYVHRLWGPRRFSLATEVIPVKLLAYEWSSKRSTAALRDQVAAALAEARHPGWDGLLAGQREHLDDFWDRGDVELDGDDEPQPAVRFALFHTLQAGARGERRAIAAKGLTGPGYDGHSLWDTETFVLPVLTYTAPHAAGDALRWRHATLDLARDRAKLLGFERCGVSMADDRRAGMLGVLVGGHSRFSHQLGHRRRRRALPGCHGRFGVRA